MIREHVILISSHHKMYGLLQLVMLTNITNENTRKKVITKRKQLYSVEIEKTREKRKKEKMMKKESEGGRMKNERAEIVVGSDRERRGNGNTPNPVMNCILSPILFPISFPQMVQFRFSECSENLLLTSFIPPFVSSCDQSSFITPV